MRGILCMVLLIALTALSEHVQKQDAALESIEAIGPGLAGKVERPKRRGQLEFGFFRKRVHGVLLELICDTARSAIRTRITNALPALSSADAVPLPQGTACQFSPPLSIQFGHAHFSVMPMSP